MKSRSKCVCVLLLRMDLYEAHRLLEQITLYFLPYFFKGLSIHTFHGNFFVRSTDLLSLPNINPDAGFAMQVTIEESLHDSPVAALQAALLYTSSKGEPVGSFPILF